jgi:hypothetical protein
MAWLEPDAVKPPGKDARTRRAANEARRRDEVAETRRVHGPDPGELEPCPWCGENGYPADLTLPSGVTIRACCRASAESAA